MEEQTLQTYFLASPATILIYDYILTFGMEIDLVWTSSLTWVKIVFLVQRYAPFMDSGVLLLYVWLSSDVSKETCLTVMNTCRWMHIIGMTASELLLTARAWGACRDTGRFQSLRLSWILVVFMAACFIPIYAVTSDMFRFTLFEPAPLGSEPVESSTAGGHAPGGCAVIHGGSSLSYLVFVMLSVYQLGLVVLLAVVGYPYYKTRKNSNVAVSSNSDILNVVFGQGILCYLILIAVSTANIVVVLAAPTSFSKLLMPLMRILHVTLTSRTVLDIRREMHKQVTIYPS